LLAGWNFWHWLLGGIVWCRSLALAARTFFC
jgi:hypothetical protein